MTAGGGWVRVVHIDARLNGCPQGFQKITTPVHVCALKSANSRGCTSAKFGTNGIAYSEVRGYTYGHQVRKLLSLYEILKLAYRL